MSESIMTINTMQHKRRNLDRLQDFRAFQKNWNGENADPFSTNLINRCEEIVELLDYDMEIFPTARSTIQFENWFLSKSYIEFEIYHNKVGLFIMLEHNKKTIEVDLYTVKPKDIAWLINAIYFFVAASMSGIRGINNGI